MPELEPPFSITGLTDESEPLVYGGAAALDPSGALLAVEVTEGILVGDVLARERKIRIATEVTPLRALAVHAGAGLVAAGAVDGLIALFWIENRDIHRHLS